jgi:hypothetical protein
MAPKGQVGQMEMKCILIFEKYFHMSQFTQVSDVAHGPLVCVRFYKLFAEMINVLDFILTEACSGE